jgi:hypothetical protein
MLPDDPREDLLFEKCAELGMPFIKETDSFYYY